MLQATKKQGVPDIRIHRREIRNGDTDSGRRANDFLLLDIFSTAFIFTGSAEKAIQDVLMNGTYADVLQDAMSNIRSGCDFNRALMGSGIPKNLSEWFCMVGSRATSDSQMMLDSWKSQASGCLARIEDAISLVIVFSSLLPVVLASLLLIIGYGNSLLVFTVVFVMIAAYWLVSRWMKRLVGPLN